jgi:MFS family permease
MPDESIPAVNIPNESIPAQPLPLLRSGVTPPPTFAPWDDLPFIQEVAVRAALVKIPLKQLQDDYQKRLDEAIEVIEKRSTLHNNVVGEEITRLLSELDDFEQSRKTLESASEQQRLSLPSLRAANGECEAEILGLLRTIVGGRFQFRLEHQQKLASARATTAIEDRQTNKEYSERAQEDARSELDDATELLEGARKSSLELQKRGLTRHVAGFLTWASYFSFAGIGVLIAQLLAPRLPDDGQQGIIQFQHMLGVGASSWDLLRAFGNYVILLAAMIAIVASLVIGAFLLLRKLDPSWGRQKRTRRKRGNSSPNEIGSWLSVFQLTSPTITKSLREVDRSALLQLLASIPIVIAIAMAAFFWIITAVPAPTAQSGTVSAKVVYIGILYAVLTASSGLLLWLFVLRPAVDNEPVGIGVKTFYSILLVLPISALIAAATLPNSANPLAIALLGVAVVVATIGLGHGIYFKGIFSRENYLEQNKDRLRESLEEIARVPTAEDYVEDPLKNLTKSLDAGDASVTRRHFLWSNLRRKPRIPNEPQLPDDPIRKLIENDSIGRLVEKAHVPEELIEKVNTACKDLASAKASLAAKDEEYRDSQDQLARINKDALDRQDRLGRMHRYQLDVLDAHDFQVLRFKIQHQRIQEALSDAYQLALLFAGSSGGLGPESPALPPGGQRT